MKENDIIATINNHDLLTSLAAETKAEGVRRKLYEAFGLKVPAYEFSAGRFMPTRKSAVYPDDAIDVFCVSANHVEATSAIHAGRSIAVYEKTFADNYRKAVPKDLEKCKFELMLFRRLGDRVLMPGYSDGSVVGDSGDGYPLFTLEQFAAIQGEQGAVVLTKNNPSKEVLSVTVARFNEDCSEYEIPLVKPKTMKEALLWVGPLQIDRWYAPLTIQEATENEDFELLLAGAGRNPLIPAKEFDKLELTVKQKARLIAGYFGVATFTKEDGSRMIESPDEGAYVEVTPGKKSIQIEVNDGKKVRGKIHTFDADGVAFSKIYAAVVKAIP